MITYPLSVLRDWQGLLRSLVSLVLAKWTHKTVEVTKVEKLNNTQEQDKSNVTESWFVMPEDPIKTFSIPQDIN